MPLGFVITSCEREEVLTHAFEALKNVLPDYAFGKRGKEIGPTIFMTDDADSEINALKKVWPRSTFLLCVWHVLNAVWRWLWLADHKVNKNDRPYLLIKFRSLVYAQTSQQYQDIKADILCDDIFHKYPNFIKHLEKSYFNRREVWSISVRNEEKLPTHSTNTSNYVEISFRLTKDGQFNRTKAYNLPDLLDIILDDSVYYKKRLLDIGNNRLGAFKSAKSRYLAMKNNIEADKIFDIGESNFIVESEKVPDTFYYVNMKSGFCECKAGQNCGPCKHKKAISIHHNISEFSVLPQFDSKIRALYHYIAEGAICKSSWYRDLENTNVDDEIVDFVEARAQDMNIIPQETFSNNHDYENDIESNQNDEVSTDDDERDDDEEVLGGLVTALESFKDRIQREYNKDWKKGVKRFSKNLLKIAKGNVNNLKQSLFDLGKQVTKSKQPGKKRKIGKLIPVQVTAKSRRTYKHRGRAVGVIGRRPKDQSNRVQLVVSDKEENIFHSLPSQKKSKNKNKHSLKNSVDANRPGTKKH